MSFHNRPAVLVGVIIAAGLCLFIAFQATALLLPFVLSSSYRWILAAIAILLTVFVGFWRARRKRKASL